MKHDDFGQLARAPRRGLTLIDVLVAVVTIALILAITLPATARLRTASMTDESIVNLLLLGVAHAAYAVDWNERQYTAVVDDISAYGDSQLTAFANYHVAGGGCDANGDPGCHPPTSLGWCQGSLWSFWANHAGNWVTYIPYRFDSGQTTFGSFRLPNAEKFHDYVDGRFYSTTFYAPADLPVREAVEDLLDHPCEFVYTVFAYWSSYSRSPAGLYAPPVLSLDTTTGLRYRDPWSFDSAHEAPPLTAATYPGLKTMMLEHHWIRNAPKDRCNPNFTAGTYDGCEPWYFNHGIDSEPATLFYDLNVRLLPNAEVQAWDQHLIQQTDVGVWSRDTPHGSNGYFLDVGYDAIVDVSHHVYTIDGIQGRDTLGSMPPPLGEGIGPRSRPRTHRSLAPAVAPGTGLEPEVGP